MNQKERRYRAGEYERPGEHKRAGPHSKALEARQAERDVDGSILAKPLTAKPWYNFLGFTWLNQVSGGSQPDHETFDGLDILIAWVAPFNVNPYLANTSNVNEHFFRGYVDFYASVFPSFISEMDVDISATIRGDTDTYTFGDAECTIQVKDATAGTTRTIVQDNDGVATCQHIDDADPNKDWVWIFTNIRITCYKPVLSGAALHRMTQASFTLEANCTSESTDLLISNKRRVYWQCNR